MTRQVKHLLGAIAVLALVGCGGSDYPDTAPVSGTVTHNGSPVANAVVSFSPQGDGHAATGNTDASGNFTLTSFEAGDGAVPGEYAVTVMKLEAGEDPYAAVPTGGESEEDLDAMYSALDGVQGGDNATAENVLPQKYANASTSGLSATVTEGENTFTFELE